MSVDGKGVLVVIPTFNRAGMIGSALASMLAQDYPFLQAIVVDDGSTDGTRTIVEAAMRSDPHKIAYRWKPNGGCASARNAGLEALDETTGFVCFLDSDDRMLPGKIAREVALLEQHSSADFSYSDSVVHVAETGVERRQTVAAAGRPREFALEHFLTLEAKPGALLYRRSVFSTQRFREDLRFNEDSDFLQRVAIASEGVYCPEPGAWVLEHAGSKSRKLADIALAVHESATSLLRDHPGFHALHRERVDCRMAQIRDDCFRALALAGRWDEAARHATRFSQRWMVRARTTAPVRLRASLGRIARLVHLGRRRFAS